MIKLQKELCYLSGAQCMKIVSLLPEHHNVNISDKKKKKKIDSHHRKTVLIFYDCISL